MSNLLITVMISCLFAFGCDQGAITFLLSLVNNHPHLPVDQRYSELKDSPTGMKIWSSSPDVS
jgi:hypothetical protein